MEEKTIYYLIFGRLVGKADKQGYYLFRDGRWVQDTEFVILDHLFGYDPYEPEGSPYAMYNSSIMEEMEEITADQAAMLCDRYLQD